MRAVQQRARRRGVPWRRVAEGVLVYALAFAAGQVIFLGWGGASLRPLAHAYWQFLFVAWAGMRLGRAGTAGLLCLVAAQAGWGALQRQGFFSQDVAANAGLGYGAYVLILSLVGLTLAWYLDLLRRQQARQRQRERAQRAALVGEVHHRIKNNLQGVTGLLQTLCQRHPSLSEPVTEVTGQVQSIAVLHGLQGRSRTEQVRLCELVREVAAGVGALWGVAIAVQLPADADAGALSCRIQPAEAVPLALIVHELLLNAVKHGGRRHQDVQVRLDLRAHGQEICLTVSNPGQWPPSVSDTQVGLELVATLMPRSGASLALEQAGARAVARLCLQAPVLLPRRADMALDDCHGGLAPEEATA